MKKVVIGRQRLVFPTPVVLVGANVKGKPNFMTVAWCGIVCSEPPALSVAIRPQRHTLIGIKENLTFSVNVPSVDLVKETDYCGLVSGAAVNKVEVCRFKVFYGRLGNAPLIEECPVNLECTVQHILSLGSHNLVVGRIEEVHVSENGLTDGKVDFNKIKPFVYAATPATSYQALGNIIGTSVGIGKKLERRE